MRIIASIITILAVMLFIDQILAEEEKDKIDEAVINESTKIFDVKAIPKKIGQIMPQLQKCYTDELEVNKGLKRGKLKINFTITTEGDTKDISIRESELNNKKVESCIAKVIAQIKFPSSPEGEIIVNYPFQY